MDYKQTIIDALDIMRKKEQAEKQTFKARAYSKVINQIKEIQTSITRYEDVSWIPGIGEKIQEKIKEILETGKLKSAERALEKHNIKALDAFQAIYGVGPVKANELVNAGYNTIQDLREAIKTQSKLLNDNQKVGLKYYEDLLERIPREEMLEHKDILESLLPTDESEIGDECIIESSKISKLSIELVGSFRRCASSSGDVDVLVRYPQNMTEKDAILQFKIYINMLRVFGHMEEILAQGDKKCMGICRVYDGKARRIDLLLTSAKEYPYALLYFTGSDKFNVAFRQWALDKGYTLNEHSLTRIHQTAPEVSQNITTEKDIFNFLGLRYIEPCDRVDHQQVIPRKRPQIGKLPIM